MGENGDEEISLSPIDGIDIEINEEGMEIEAGPARINIKDPRIWKIITTVGTVVGVIAGLYYSMG